jgi:hypothetical protein
MSRPAVMPIKVASKHASMKPLFTIVLIVGFGGAKC